MRVGFDISAAMLGNPGVGRYTGELGDALAREPDITVDRIGVSQQRSASPMRNAERAMRSLITYPLDLGRQARSREVDLVHCPAPIAPVRTSLPVVLTLHDLLPWRYPEGYGRFTRFREQSFTRRAARSAARILVASEFTRAEAIECLDLSPEKVAVVPHGVDERFGPLTLNMSGRAHRFGIPPGKYLLWVGTGEPRKNLSAVLDAFGLVRQQVQDVYLVLVGDWARTDAALEREIGRRTTRIIRPGFVTDDELAMLYSEASCFVFPSLYEGFGFPPLEAMACGAPVVASNRGSVKEVVGDAGILVEPTEPQAIADAVVSVITSPERSAELRQRGLERANEFTWQETARKTVEQYRAALGAA